ncbi:hypothetical protein FEI14_12535 [Lacticaseibacillus zeae]|uniref:Uncharacterized protein n=1 Tax=Lacticaseibacillus zeae TaxID=57037 RepID=A0A5R8LQJ3_LACZE|nr:hypothetical protein FEI14_12535 [Lacticaseibacillus zeae]
MPRRSNRRRFGAQQWNCCWWSGFCSAYNKAELRDSAGLAEALSRALRSSFASPAPNRRRLRSLARRNYPFCQTNPTAPRQSWR